MRNTMTPEEQFQHKNELGIEASFESAMQAVLAERAAQCVPPQGLEQRLLARLAQAAELWPTNAGRAREPFTFAEIGKSPRSAKSLWTALGIHGVAVALIAFVVAAKVHAPAIKAVHVAMLVDHVRLPPPLATRQDTSGGGGQHDLTPATQGRLPKFAREQIIPPTQAPKIPPRLAVDPTVVMQDNPRMANNDLVNLGLPNSNLRGVSLGSGNGTGVGSGTGPGVGPGSGGGVGGGPFHVGGSVRAPALVYQPDPEFSEEARKAKFSGNVEVYLWVDEQGNPSHVKVVRGVGMGLDEKALEAVRQYKFKPATQNGKAVKVDLYVEVSFTIF